ncbi:MAG: three-Cys-motif partner protein TcmP [Dehalococcoidia bacterium]|nr:three-Cys-motif partner protein TcmP [Dehalococcoidia bacterium]
MRRDARPRNCREKWLLCELCSSELHSDGHPLLELGPWSQQKIFYLQRYADMFSTGMKNHWPTRAYIDLFAGPGIYRVRSSPDEVNDGSSLVVLKQKTPFTHYAFVDSDEGHVKALQARMANLAPGSQKKAFPGNCNDLGIVSQLLAFIPRNA